MRKSWFVLPACVLVVACADGSDIQVRGDDGKDAAFDAKPESNRDGSSADGGTDGSIMAPDFDGGNPVGPDGQALKPCVHNEDCAVPNLCEGNNGQECRAGYCVGTGAPHSCDDGVSLHRRHL